MFFNPKIIIYVITIIGKNIVDKIYIERNMPDEASGLYPEYISSPSDKKELNIAVILRLANHDSYLKANECQPKLFTKPLNRQIYHHKSNA